MPSKKKKYNARFPAGRIKKIMQTDEEIGKVAQAVPVIISRTLELFVESLLKRAMQITSAKNAKTLTSTHMKQCILSESRFDFLKDLVKGIPDVSSTDDEFGTPSGNLSPGTPLSAKAYGSFSGFQFLQSADGSSSRSSGATSQPSTPQPTQPTLPTLPTQHTQPSQPKFYKEIPIGGDSFENRIDENSAPPVISETPVVQHTGSLLSNHCPPLLPVPKTEGNPSLLRTISGRNITQLNELKLSNCIKASDHNSRATSEKENEVEEDEDELDDDEEEEDEKRFAENGYHGKTYSAKTCTIDEDYDT